MENLPDMPGLSANTKEHGDLLARPLSLAWITDELLAETQRVWSEVYGREISADEATEILMNVKRFAQVLLTANQERERRDR